MRSRGPLVHAAAILASAALAGLYVRGGPAWGLGFVLLLPWLLALDRLARARTALASALALSVAYTAAVFPWLGAALGAYTGIGEGPGLALLLLAAPVLQPQFMAFALVRHGVRIRHGATTAALCACAAWVATETLVPRLLDDTLGLGLYPSPTLRQAAAAIGTAGLTLVLLLVNEALAASLRQRAACLPLVVRPLAAAVGLLLALELLGAACLPGPAPTGTPTLRMGLVQSAIVDYERLRREKGAGAVVREVLDTHYAMSHDAVERQRVQAVLWSETVYPTTFARPKSEAGAELDQEIAGIVNAAGVPFVFGTYDRDEAGEYNAAAFMAPGSGLVGVYRKTRLFPLTEWVPAWLDGPRLRRWLPWAGGWRPGDGARVLPLRLADGREVPALPLICLDAVDTRLALAGARLGAQVILSLSNDAWFTAHPLGAELHLRAAAFRSVETGLPQFRVTSNGFSAIIDRDGRVVARSRMGERTLVVGEVALPESASTPLVAWGDSVGRAAAVALGLAAAVAVVRRLQRTDRPPGERAGGDAVPLPQQVAVLPAPLRALAALLRSVSRASLLLLAAAALAADSAWQAGSLAQMRAFAAAVLAPELAAWALLAAYRARLTFDGSRLRLSRGDQRVDVKSAEIASLRAWRLPLPAPGLTLQLASGRRWRLCGVDAEALATALRTAGAAPRLDASGFVMRWAQARRSLVRGRLDRAWVRFGLLPAALAVPAFRLHQHIAHGGSFGEWLAFGPLAFAKGFGLWWASWAIGVALVAMVLRSLVELATLLAVATRPARAVAWRQALHRAEQALLFLGLPAWLAWRALAG